MIETERLLLRRHRLDDFDASHAMWSNPLVTRYIGGRPRSRDQNWSWLLAACGHWDVLGYGYWVIEEQSSRAFIGEVGFGNFMRTIDPPFDVPEAGWVLHPSMHGRGYGEEALRAALHWADAHFTDPDTVAMVVEGNDASVRLAVKVGYTERARTTYGDSRVIILKRPRAAAAAHVANSEIGHFSSLDHVQIAMPARGEDEARLFYGHYLGFEELAKPAELVGRGGAWFCSRGITIHLGVDPQFVPATKAHAAFRCASYDSFVRFMRANGFDVAEDPLLFGGARHCYINDPFGNRLEFIEDR